jgi:pimeloyl-ACP methyl ester carboxylesterase
MQRLKGLKDLLFDTIENTTHLVERSHLSVAKKYERRITYLAPATPVKAVNAVHCLCAKSVYRSIRTVTRGVRLATDGGFALATRSVGDKMLKQDTPPTRLTSETTDNSQPNWFDTAQGALNGAIGDYLEQRGNQLALAMVLRYHDKSAPLDSETLARILPHPRRKICLFVHGLGCTEQVWKLGAQGFYGDPKQNFGSLLERDLGYIPLYLRYNSGLHISHNGKRLANLIAELMAVYPGPVDELVLIGHSMGGLVVRSAIHYATRDGLTWVDKLKQVFCIGSPHLGAHLEKAGNVLGSVLSFFDTPGTQVPAQLIKLRSAGIKDLRYGYVVDEDWQGYDPDLLLNNTGTPIPLADTINYCLIAATVTHDTAHPLGQIVGDLLVCHKSAAGPAPQSDQCIPVHFKRVFSGMNHFHLANHPEVYEQIKQLCAGDPLPR